MVEVFEKKATFFFETKKELRKKKRIGEEETHVERQQPGPLLGSRALVPRQRGRLLRRQRQRRRRQALDDLGVGDQLLERLGRVEHVVRELRRQLGQLLLHLVELRLLGALERDAAEREVAELGVDGPAARVRQLRERLPVGLQGRERVVERPRLRQPERERDALRLHLLDGGAQLGRVLDGLQVRDAAPGASQAVGQALERLDDLGPDARGRAVFGSSDLGGDFLEIVERGADLRQQGADSGDDVFGLDAVEGRERGVLFVCLGG